MYPQPIITPSETLNSIPQKADSIAPTIGYFRDIMIENFCKDDPENHRLLIKYTDCLSNNVDLNGNPSDLETIIAQIEMEISDIHVVALGAVNLPEFKKSESLTIEYFSLQMAKLRAIERSDLTYVLNLLKAPKSSARFENLPEDLDKSFLGLLTYDPSSYSRALVNLLQNNSTFIDPTSKLSYTNHSYRDLIAYHNAKITENRSLQQQSLLDRLDKDSENLEREFLNYLEAHIETLVMDIRTHIQNAHEKGEIIEFIKNYPNNYSSISFKLDQAFRFMIPLIKSERREKATVSIDES